MVKIDLGKRDFVWIGLVVVLLGVGFVFAYSGDMLAGDASVMGHSGGEMNVNIGGELMKLQDALDGGYIGGGLASPACTMCQSCGGDWPVVSGLMYSYYAPNALGIGCAGAYDSAARWIYLCCR